MTQNKIFAQAWTKAAEIILDVDMSEYTVDEEVIDAMHGLAEGAFMDQAKMLNGADEELRRVHSNLKTPPRNDGGGIGPQW